MSSTADRPEGEPPLIPYVPGLRAPVAMPESVALPIVVESGWTKVARAIAIVRDLLLIFVLAALIYFGSAILARVGQSTGTDSTPVDPAITCPAPATPRADQWGTFCETPGG